MRSILVLLEDLVQSEFGPRELAAIRAKAADRMSDVGRLPGAPGRVMSFMEATADIRSRPVHDVYQFVAIKLTPVVLKEYSQLLQGHSSSRTVLMQITRLAQLVMDDLVPGVPLTDFDVELIDLETLRVRFEGPVEMLAAFEGIAMALATHFGERAETARVLAPAYAPDRRLLDIRIGQERRASPPKPTSAAEHRRRFGL